MGWDKSRETWFEPGRKLDALGSFDVVVVGAGSAGIAAALAAGRLGAEVLLVERYGHLGGYFAYRPGSGSGLAFHDSDGNHIIKGIGWEIIERLVAEGGAIPPIEMVTRTDDGLTEFASRNKYRKSRPIIDFEALNSLVFRMCEESNVHLLLHSLVAGVIVEAELARGIIVESKSGRQVIWAKVIIDATGDADVSALAGAAFQKAPREEMYELQRHFRLGNVDTERVLNEMRKRASELTSYSYPVNPFDIPPGFQAPMSVSIGQKVDVEVSDDDMVIYYRHRNVAPGEVQQPSIHFGIDYRKNIGNIIAATVGDGVDVLDLVNAEVEIRKKVDSGLKWLRENVPGYEFAYVLATGESPLMGVRGTRRVIGDYIITEEDIVEGRKFEDVVARSSNSIDLHWPKGDIEIRRVKGWHDIPYRVLVPNQIDGVLVAGRCVSCTHIAQGAMRKIPVCMATGEAAGTAAALCVEKGVMPRNLPVMDLQAELKNRGALIYLRSTEKYTLALGLQQFRSALLTEWGGLMAASTLVTLPIIVLFFFTQKTFIQGISLTGLKG